MGTGCGLEQSEYYEIQVIVVDNQAFYFIDPSAGKDTIGDSEFGLGQNQFIYLYEPVEGVEFDYTQFFSAIGTKRIEENIPKEKYYLLATQEIDNLVNEYFYEKAAWEANQS